MTLVKSKASCRAGRECAVRICRCYHLYSRHAWIKKVITVSSQCDGIGHLGVALSGKHMTLASCENPDEAAISMLLDPLTWHKVCPILG